MDTVFLVSLYQPEISATSDIKEQIQISLFLIEK